MHRIPLIVTSVLATLLLVLQPSVAFAAHPRQAPEVGTFWTGNFGYEGFAVSHRRIAATSCGTPYELKSDGTFEFRAFPRPGCWELENARGAGAAFSQGRQRVRRAAHRLSLSPRIPVGVTRSRPGGTARST